MAGGMPPAYRLTPSWFFVNADAEHGLGHEFAGQKGVGWVHTSQSCIAEESLNHRLFEDAKPSCQVHGHIDYLPGTLDRPVLDGNELGPPQHAVVNTV